MSATLYQLGDYCRPLRASSLSKAFSAALYLLDDYRETGKVRPVSYSIALIDEIDRQDNNLRAGEGFNKFQFIALANTYARACARGVMTDYATILDTDPVSFTVMRLNHSGEIVCDVSLTKGFNALTDGVTHVVHSNGLPVASSSHFGVALERFREKVFSLERKIS
jgi:hypothetical protein